MQDKRDALNLGGALCIPLLLFGIVGATGEYRHRTLAPAVLIAPDRHAAGARAAGRLRADRAGGRPRRWRSSRSSSACRCSPRSRARTSRRATTRVIVGGGHRRGDALHVALGVGVGMLVKQPGRRVVGALMWLFILEPLIPLIDEWLDQHCSILGSAATLGGAEPDEGTWAGSLLVLGLWAAVFVRRRPRRRARAATSD